MSCAVLPCRVLSCPLAVFVQQFYEPGDAAHAKDRLDGYNLDGRNISVLYAQVCADFCRCRYCVPYCYIFACAVLLPEFGSVE